MLETYCPAPAWTVPGQLLRRADAVATTLGEHAASGQQGHQVGVGHGALGGRPGIHRRGAVDGQPVELAQLAAQAAHDGGGQPGHGDDHDVVGRHRCRRGHDDVGGVERVVAGLRHVVVPQLVVGVEVGVLGAHDPVDRTAARRVAAAVVVDVASARRPQARSRCDRTVVAVAVVLVAEGDERRIRVGRAQLVGQRRLHGEAGVTPLLRGPSDVGGVVSVEEPHTSAGVDVLQEDVRHPARGAGEVGDRQRLGLEQLPGVGAPADRVDRRSGRGVQAGVGLPAGAHQLLEAHSLGRLELLEAHHVQLLGLQKGHDAVHAHDAGFPPLAVAARSGVVGTQHVEGGRAEERGRCGLQDARGRRRLGPGLARLLCGSGAGHGRGGRQCQHGGEHAPHRPRAE